MPRKALLLFIALAPVAALDAAAESRDRPSSEAQQRFERAQQHSDLQDLKATLDRQRAAIRAQRNAQSASPGERARQGRELRESSRSLHQQRQRYQNQRTPSEPAADG